MLDTKSSPVTPAALALEQSAQYIGAGRTKFYGLQKEPDFVRPIMVGKAKRWLVRDLDAWLDRQAAKRDTAPTKPLTV